MSIETMLEDQGQWVYQCVYPSWEYTLIKSILWADILCQFPNIFELSLCLISSWINKPDFPFQCGFATTQALNLSVSDKGNIWSVCSKDLISISMLRRIMELDT